MRVAEAVGRALAEAGVARVFGVVGSGNFHVTNALIKAGIPFVAARHEGGAATMADAFARVSGQVAALSVHQGCGLTNAMTGIAEAGKSRTPLVVLAAEVTTQRSNFYVDQAALATAVGAVPRRITDPANAADDAAEAVRFARAERRTVVLNLPLDVQSQEASSAPAAAARASSAADPVNIARLVEALAKAQQPVFVAGRGARGAAAELAALADACGALLAESAVAKGLFRHHPWGIGVSGGFASPGTAELVRSADLIVGWGCTLNMWTMRHGRLIAPDAVVVQVDDTAGAIGAHRELAFGVVADVGTAAQATLTALPASTGIGYRTPRAAEVIATRCRWQDIAYDDASTDALIDPRALTIALDELLPAERIVAVDSGNFMGYPSMFLDVPDEHGFCFTQAFQSIGLGLATAIGAALARPDRLPVAALGDGGALMAAAELETVARLDLGMLLVVYDDHAYGAEVHHFGSVGVDRHDLSTVVFPDTDIAAIAAGYGLDAITVRTVDDLAPVREWLAGARATSLLIDAKIVDAASWWLQEAFRGH